MIKTAVYTAHAPKAIGTDSQAVRTGDTVYISGQIPLDPNSMTLVQGDILVQINQVFKNLAYVAQAAGGDLDHIVKLTIYLTDLAYYPTVNSVMTQYFNQPYPARALVQVSGLPKHASIEIEAVMVLNATPSTVV